MPISSKTPPTARVAKSAAGNRTAAGFAAGGEVVLSPGILDQLQDAVFTTRLDGTITSCNQGVSRYGFTTHDLVGRKIADLYGAGRQSILAAQALASVVEKGRFEGELRCRTKSGHDVDVHLCLTLLREANAAAAGILGSPIAIPEKRFTTARSSSANAEVPPLPLARREID